MSAVARENRQLRGQQRRLNLEVSAGRTTQNRGTACKQRTDGPRDHQPPAERLAAGLGLNLDLRALGKPKLFTGDHASASNQTVLVLSSLTEEQAKRSISGLGLP